VKKDDVFMEVNQMPRLKHNHPKGKEPKPKTKNPFEETVKFYIDNENDKSRALEFSAWLRVNKMAPLAAKTEYNWYINIGGNHVCHIRMYNGTWYIWPCRKIQNEFYNREDLKKILLSNIFHCLKCSHEDGCTPRTTVTLFGETKTVCHSHTFAFKNPGTHIIEALKEILIKEKAK
jgi:hypothetical protein